MKCSFMNRFILVFLLFLLKLPYCSQAQDTIRINEIRLTSSLVKQNLLQTTAAAALIDSLQLTLQAIHSFVPAFNAIPGARMEERSPGSYRLSLRGSLLRSPFGVRNVKIYMDDFPLTDAGGNTYINTLPMYSMGKIEILKGPDGSLFGANSGGVVIFQPGEKIKKEINVSGGSFGLFKEDVTFTKTAGKNLFSFTESYQRSDGYRANSKLHRFNIQVKQNIQYNAANSIKFLAFYTDLFYKTPGGLTQRQYDSFPAQARAATATLPGAIQQKAAVYNKMGFAGLSHNARFNKYLENTVAVFGSRVDFKNPFITNFETRKEHTYGVRTFFTFSNNSFSINRFNWEYVIGCEWQQTDASISNYVNLSGNKGRLMAAGKVLTDQHFIFNRIKTHIDKKLIIEAGLSINYYSYRFRDSFLLRNHFEPRWMPRFAISYTPVKTISLRSSVSRGYSTPTTAEIRPADIIYKDLRAETGTNIEFGARFFAFANRFWVDLSVYNYQLKHAIVPQQDTAGSNFFVNAGSTKQQAVEMQLSWLIVSPQQPAHFIKKILFNNSCSLNDFTFNQYSINGNDYSGNKITGVPDVVVVNNVLMEINKGPYFFIQYNYTGKIPVNDANNVFAKNYHLVQVKCGYTFRIRSFFLELYSGVDNLLNEQYSLGNDLNAAGNRFFNAAPLRNYYAGLRISGYH